MKKKTTTSFAVKVKTAKKIPVDDILGPTMKKTRRPESIETFIKRRNRKAGL